VAAHINQGVVISARVLDRGIRYERAAFNPEGWRHSY